MTLQPLERLLWVDIETTGLDVKTEVLLEVGFVLTDLDLKIVGGFHSLVWEPFYPEVIDRSVEYVKNMHTENKLFQQAEADGKPLAKVEQLFNRWINHHELGKEDPLCGSTVRFDRGWLEELWPSTMAKLSHRVIDNSSIKELCRRYNPTLYDKLQKDVIPEKAHRVLPDLTDTVEEFQFYRDNFLFWKD